eukprot:CAMPEP_0177702902 /NCGR_PEP_ID=MMETSP0484_2-20121128/7379_1 /TAXON_ID=354590 /ORGANISM="Rhodomonas lens, Strain RHODO" /LENGTH=116 /DNA_ID=CAMNT_0019214207 /DNA_START=547 /DNA_END=897 /DNA_ORIENTATION=-
MVDALLVLEVDLLRLQIQDAVGELLLALREVHLLLVEGQKDLVNLVLRLNRQPQEPILELLHGQRLQILHHLHRPQPHFPKANRRVQGELHGIALVLLLDEVRQLVLAIFPTVGVL